MALEACGSVASLESGAQRNGAHGEAAARPQPYVKRGKNDAADAEALCEAASRPTMRYSPVQTANQ